MLLILKRRLLKKSTPGKLFIEGQYFCDTLEDIVRDLKKEKKVYGETAIPAGKYDVILSMSTRFKKVWPELLNVPHFKGVRIHKGNRPEDTEGCILVGIKAGRGVIGQSKSTFKKLLTKLHSANQIEIIVKGTKPSKKSF